ncbi:CPA_1a_G0055740.mRNA.1.CDS.1 [Saccharomyces cerevisiae]|nr:CPA_1a_G0055740.mRNA.1.CDS.1 [Saccharomyces cerevisiae]CAI7484085.1 CPA_1a_G0055740.mRNA.1.CDS.1 [Saccharomyces cerevisiae]
MDFFNLNNNNNNNTTTNNNNTNNNNNPANNTNNNNSTGHSSNTNNNTNNNNTNTGASGVDDFQNFFDSKPFDQNLDSNNNNSNSNHNDNNNSNTVASSTNFTSPTAVVNNAAPANVTGGKAANFIQNQSPQFNSPYDSNNSNTNLNSLSPQAILAKNSIIDSSNLPLQAQQQLYGGNNNNNSTGIANDNVITPHFITNVQSISQNSSSSTPNTNSNSTPNANQQFLPFNNSASNNGNLTSKQLISNYAASNSMDRSSSASNEFVPNTSDNNNSNNHNMRNNSNNKTSNNNNVTAWSMVAQRLQISDYQQLESIYFRILLPYERHMISQEGIKETQAKRIFLQQFLQELLKKVQQQQQAAALANANNNINSASSAPTPAAPGASVPATAAPGTEAGIVPVSANTPKSLNSNININVNNNSIGQQQVKKPRKQRVKKKTKKELELERKEREDFQKRQQKLLEDQQRQQKLLLETKLRQQYEIELKKLPKVYKRSIVRNYKPLISRLKHYNGYDINYISKIGEKIDSNRPIFLFAPELGAINLHALSMSLQSKNLGEINTALNTLLVTSADSNLKISLVKYPELLDSLAMLGMNLLSNLSQNVVPYHRNTSDYYYEDAGSNQYYVTQHDKMVDKIFEKVNNNGTLTPNDSNDEKVTILVDSLTGNQLPTPTPTEMEPDLDTECFISMQSTSPVVKQWDLLPEPIRFLPNQFPLKIHRTPYLTSLKKIKDEIDDPFTKINTRGAEDPKVLINDQLSTISMILRNISFSDNNSRIMSRNFYLKRFISDLLWLVLIHPENFTCNRKILNFKKDLVIVLSNISHLLEIASSIDCLLILILVISFGQPKLNPMASSSSFGSESLTFNEFQLQWGKYQTFGVDILAKLFSLEKPNLNYFKSILLNKNTGNNLYDRNSNNNHKDKKLLRRLLNLYNDNNKNNNNRHNLLNDVVSFLFSAIPLQQVLSQSADPSLLIDQFSPVISQSLTSILVIVQKILPLSNEVFEISENNSDSNSNNNGNKDSSFNFNKNLPFVWLSSEENIGSGLLKLSEIILNINNSTSKNTLLQQQNYSKVLLPSINISCVQLIKCLVEKSICFENCLNNDPEILKKIASIPNLFPTDLEIFQLFTNPSVDIQIINQYQLLYNLKNDILTNLK